MRPDRGMHQLMGSRSMRACAGAAVQLPISTRACADGATGWRSRSEGRRRPRTTSRASLLPTKPIPSRSTALPCGAAARDPITADVVDRSVPRVVTVASPARWARPAAQVPLLPLGAARRSLHQEGTSAASWTLRRSPMGQGEPDEGCLHIPHVAPGLVCDLQDAGEFVTLTSGDQSEMASCLGCTRIEGLPGTRPDAAQLPKEEPDRYRSPPRKVV